MLEVNYFLKGLLYTIHATCAHKYLNHRETSRYIEVTLFLSQGVAHLLPLNNIVTIRNCAIASLWHTLYYQSEITTIRVIFYVDARDRHSTLPKGIIKMKQSGLILKRLHLEKILFTVLSKISILPITPTFKIHAEEALMPAPVL